MEKWKMIEMNNTTFNVGNKGSVQILGRNKNLLRTLKNPEDFSKNGGHPGSRYLSILGLYIHRIVATAWISPIPDKYEVNHIDGDKWNNNVKNLEIVTRSENKRHAINSGLNKWKITQEEKDRRKAEREAVRLSKQFVVLDLEFNILNRHKTIYEASASIDISRQLANTSYRTGRPMLKKFYICRDHQIEELKNRITGGK